MEALTRRCTEMHFGENQLSRNLIGLSPLAPGHRPGFQPRSVRSSTRSYPRFNLPRARSSRFGSRTRDWNALIGLAFATAAPHGLASPRTTDSQTHFSIGTPSPRKAPTDCRHTVSETLSLPSRGAFHLSLTVLVRYRSDRNIQAYPTVGADSHGIPRVPRYLGTRTGRRRAFGYGAITLYGREFNPVRLTRRFITAAGPVGARTPSPTTPMPQPPTGLTRHRFGHHPLSLATTHGISFPAGTEMFHFPAYPPHECGAGPSRPAGYPIRTPSDQSPVGGSPRPIAAPRVLHRSCLPRHPPCALADNTTTGHATTTTTANCQTTNHHTKRSQNDRPEPTHMGPDETIQQTASPTASHPLASTIQFSNHQHTIRTRHRAKPHAGPDGHQEHHPQGWRSGNPTAHPCHSLKTVPRQHAHTIRPSGRTRRHDPHASHAGDFHNLRRKEVIQPHLPVRLPCYDLVPIADLTLDGSPPYGLGHRLRVLPTFMT